MIKLIILVSISKHVFVCGHVLGYSVKRVLIYTYKYAYNQECMQLKYIYSIISQSILLL